MKIEKDNEKIIIYLNKKNKIKIDTNNDENLEKKFKQLFKKLKEIYNIDMSGCIEITIYNNETYGNILEITKEEIEYFEYYDAIDMKITISKYNDILYKIDNIENIDGDIYTYNGEIYLRPKKNEFQQIGKIIENSEIIYGRKCYEILKKAKKNHKFAKQKQNMYN